MTASDPSPPFEPRVALASLSGEADAAWARAGASETGLALLGGIALDQPTRRAARELVADGRSEFLPPEPTAWIDDQLTALADADLRVGVNVRASDPEPVERAAAVCARHDAVVEVNAHCRQSAMCAAGAGETLLTDPAALAEQVSASVAQGATTSVKLRAEVSGVDLPAVAERAVSAGASIVHVDAMDSEGTIALVAGRVPEAIVIANNGVRDRRTVREYLACGADAVSLGRPSDNPPVRRRVARAVREWFHETDQSQRSDPSRPERAAPSPPTDHTTPEVSRRE